MVCCKYKIGRKVPVSFNKKENSFYIEPNSFFLCHITDGCAVLVINGKQSYLGANTLLCLSCIDNTHIVKTHKIKAQSITFSPEFVNVNLKFIDLLSTEFNEICKQYCYPDFKMFLDRNIMYNGILPLTGEESRCINRTFNDIIQQIDEQPDIKWSCRVRSYIFFLFDKIDFFLNEYQSNDIIRTSIEMDALDYINLNISKTVSISDLCAQLHINRTSLENKFKLFTGESISSYITNKRVEIAKYSLSFTELSLDEISMQCGFNEQSYFSRVFKLRVGKTPLEYRKLMKQRRLKNNEI